MLNVVMMSVVAPHFGQYGQLKIYLRKNVHIGPVVCVSFFVVVTVS